ncbi:hypothetical protein C7S14_6338 [Burkholderia cepacia]|nr:hypothetical protein C7S14_6338 [Burkholderia cepacia]
MRHADEAVRAGQLQLPVHSTGGSHEKPAMRPARLNDVNDVDNDREVRRCCAG